VVDTDTSEWQYWFGHSGGLGSGLGVGNTTNLFGTMTNESHADGVYQKMQAGSTAGNGAACVSMNATPSDTLNNVFFDQDFDVTLIVRTGSSVTHVRIWFVLYDTNTRMGNNDSFSGSANVIGFRFSEPGGDTFWNGFCQDGASAATVAGFNGGATIAASTKYTLRIRKVASTVYFSVDGGTELSTSSHVPTGNIAAQLDLEVWTTLNGATHFVEVSRIGCTIG
jgi:hypothetical protein